MTHINFCVLVLEVPEFTTATVSFSSYFKNACDEAESLACVIREQNNEKFLEHQRELLHYVGGCL